MAVSIPFLCVLSVTYGLTLDIITSQRTPQAFLLSFKESLTTLSTEYRLDGTFKHNYIELPDYLKTINSQEDESELLLDLTWLEDVPYTIKQHAVANEIPILVTKGTKRTSPISFKIFGTDEKQSAAISALLLNFEWKRMLVLVKTEYKFIEIAAELEDYLDISDLRIDYLYENMAYTTLESYITKTSRQFGYKAYLILGDGVFASNIESILNNGNLLNKGTITIYTGEACWAAKTIGSLCFIEAGLEKAVSQSEYMALAVVSILKDLNVELQKVTGTKVSYVDLLRKIFPNQVVENALNFYNQQEIGLTKVGEFNSVLVIEQNITFIGPTNHIPNTNKITISVTISDGEENPTIGPGPINTLILHGVHIAITDINTKTDFLPYYTVELNSVSCGALEFGYDFARACLEENKETIETAFIHSVSISVANNIYPVFEDVGISIPQISATVESNLLTDKEKFKYFVRCVGSKDYKVYIMTLLLDLLGIRQVAIMYKNSTLGLDFYAPFLESSKLFGIEILNSEETRVIPFDLTRDQITDFKDTLQAIIDTKARFLIYIEVEPFILEGLVDMGMKPGDIILILQNSDDFLTEDYDSALRIQEFLSGALSFEIASFIGDLGEYVYEEIVSQLDIIPRYSQCLNYDAGLLISEALDFMTQKGEDYHDPDLMNTRIREVRFTGCSGTVYIDSNSNDRGGNVFDVYNGQYNKTSGFINFIRTAVFDPTGIVILSNIADFIWIDGSTIKPPDLRSTDNTCPFAREDVETSSKGTATMILLNVGISLFVLGITALIFRPWCALRYYNLTERKEMFPNDWIIYLSIIIEGLQLTYLGPDVAELAPLYYDVTAFTMFLFESFIVIPEDDYWSFMPFTIGLCFAWLVLCLIVVYSVHEKIPRLRCVSELYNYGMHLLPLFSMILFFPILSMFSRLFDCQEGVGSNLSDSFLSWDCNMWCWKDAHLVYASLGIMILVIYGPLAVFSRIVWQNRSPELNIRAQPLGVLVKASVQIFVILVRRVVYSKSELIHGLLFLIILIGYEAFLLKYRLYTYHRVNLFQITVIGSAIWLAFVALIDNYIFNGWSLMFYTAVLPVWIVIFGFGSRMILKESPLLFTQKNKDIAKLIKFQFSNKGPEEFEVFQKEGESASKYQLEMNKIGDHRKRNEPFRLPDAIDRRLFPTFGNH